jgi:hypothetical protein
MSDDKMEYPTSLDKKKCQCGTLLKNFFVGGAPLMPEWIALGLYDRSVSNEVPPIVQSTGMTDFLSIILFMASCAECGNVTFWTLGIDEIQYMRTKEGNSNGYRILWVYNPEFIKNKYSEYPDGLNKKMFKLAEVVESFRLGEKDK